MAPEQLEGRPADERTDIFALGGLLYEMSTGKHTFSGTSKAQVMTAILSADPAPISSVQPMAPPALDHVVRRCLAKDPEDRWQSARDVANELKWVSESSASGVSARLVTRKSKERVGWILATLLLAALAAYLFATRSVKTQELIKVSVMPAEGTKFLGHLAISPDGRSVAFVVKTIDGVQTLWIRSLDSLNARKLPGTEDATMPFWSPDSKSVGFFAQGKMKKIDIAEGPPATICDAPIGRGGTWNQDGTILFSPNFTSPSLYRVAVNGGNPTIVLTVPSGQTALFPHFLPDGKHFLFQVSGGSNSDTRGNYTGSIDSSQFKRVLGDVARSEYAGGFIFFVREKNLMAQRFDLQRLEATGEAVAIAENIGFDGAYHSFSFSKAGRLCYSTVDLVNTELVWFDRNGKEIQKVGNPGQFIEPTFSPDEKKIVLGRVDPSSNRTNLWTVDLARATFARLTIDVAANNYGSLWSPDGSRIVYSASHGGGVFDLFERPANGSSGDSILLTTKNAKFSDDWSRDGRYIVYESEDPKTKYDLWILPLFGDRKPFPFVQSDFNDAHARFSPDGNWIAYASDEIGRSEIYVRHFPDNGGGKTQVSAAGGDQPYWRGDGKELFFLTPDAKLMAVEVKTSGATFESGVPTALFQTYVIPQGLVGSDRNQYVVSADGQRFLINSSPAQALFAPITLVFNWPALLKQP